MTEFVAKPPEENMAVFKGKSITDIASLTLEEVETILQTAAYYDHVLSQKKRIYDMDGKIMAALFFEPSTRTRLSFEAAMERLGGKTITVIETQELKISSTAKGETLYDMIRMVNFYCDVISCRSPIEGAREEINRAAEVPYINAGDGAGEHPSQALLDLYTIIKEKGSIDGLTYAICGDLRYGRAAHSFVNALAKFPVKKIILSSPHELTLPPEYIEKIKAMGVEVEECYDLDYAASSADVIYMTRVQKERMKCEAKFVRNKDLFIMTASHVKMFRKDAIVMHPLPRLNEIELAVDDYPGAAYFRQAGNGLPIRMALLALVTGSVK
jgi:aspartate carbamoyltransferase catalytic subunit